MKDTTPWDIAGCRRCGTAGLYRVGAGWGYPQAAQPAVDMWIIEFPQIAVSISFEDLERAVSST